MFIALHDIIVRFYLIRQLVRARNAASVIWREL